MEAWYPDFGDCLFAAIAQLLQRGHNSAVVLNSDSPTLPTSLLVEAAEVLARPGDRAVLGPADDGGYYLLGVKAAHRGLFRRTSPGARSMSRGKPWSVPASWASPCTLCRNGTTWTTSGR